jgi:hypothetical protein
LAEQTPKPEEGAQPQQQQSEIILNDKTAHSAYSNFARVTATPEEVIIDFGLNPNPFMQGKQEVVVTQRLIMNFYTAKRLLSALGMTLQRHEQTFGSVELDVRRRAQLLPGGAQGIRQP